MLTILLSTFSISIILLGFGAWFSRFFGKIEGPLQLWAGILFIYILSHCWAFFFPLNGYFSWTIFAIGLFLFILYLPYIPLLKWKNKFGYKTLFFLILSLIFLGSFPTLILDYYNYYLQTMQWLQLEGFVRGIASFDLNLGQMSGWHVLAAFLGHGMDTFHRINVVLLIYFSVYCYWRNFFLGFIFLPLLLFFSHSPSPDLAAIIISIIVLVEFFEGNSNFSFLFALSMMALSIKPTFFWLPMAVFIYLLWIKKIKNKDLALGICIGCIFFIKNIICFGNPFFPISTPLLSFSWIPSAELLQNAAEIGQQKGLDMQYSLNEIQNFKSGEYLYRWIKIDGLKGFLHKILVIIFVVFTFWVFFQKKVFYYILWGCLAIKTLVVFYVSFQYRFLLEIFFIPILLMAWKYRSYRVFINASTSLMGLTLILFIQNKWLHNRFPEIRGFQTMHAFNFSFLIKPKDYQWDKYSVQKVGNLHFNLVEGNIFPYNVPLPALTREDVTSFYNSGVFPQLRKNTIRAGFETRPITVQQKREIENILKENKKNKHDL